MHISRIKISNFANFSEVDLKTGGNIVIVGENKVGKSNFVRALQLILDPGLSERDRQLSLEHFWDGLGEDKLGKTVEIAVELTDFTDDLKNINVPVLVMHSEDDQIVPYVASGPMSAKLLKNGTLKTYPGFSHGMLPVNADVINADLLAFIRG